MQVRAGHPARGADSPEQVATFDYLAGTNVDA